VLKHRLPVGIIRVAYSFGGLGGILDEDKKIGFIFYIPDFFRPDHPV
jgi:hypothetical protein